MTQEDIIALKKRLSTPQNIAIVIHYNPDGDAFGSSLALAMYLTKLGHHVNVLSPNIYPAYLAWMPNCDKVLLATEQLQRCESILAEADIIFCLDFNIFHRASLLENALAASKKFKVLIDHHIDPVQDFDIIYSLTTQTSSTSELVYQLIAHKFGDKHLIDKKMAECMYVGIMTDTGSLSYSCNFSII